MAFTTEVISPKCMHSKPVILNSHKVILPTKLSGCEIDSYLKQQTIYRWSNFLFRLVFLSFWGYSLCQSPYQPQLKYLTNELISYVCSIYVYIIYIYIICIYIIIHTYYMYIYYKYIF